MELNKSYIYAYYIPDRHAIKVGFGDDPAARMRSYTAFYGIVAEEKSLCSWAIPAAGLASNIESACHQTLIKAGFPRISLKVNGQEATEIFSLDHFDFDDAVALVVEEIDQILNSVANSIAATRYRSDHQQDSKKKKILEERQRARELDIAKAVKLINANWNEAYDEFCLVVKLADSLWRSMTFKQRSSFLAIFKGYILEDDVFAKWSGVPKCIEQVPKILHSARKAKKFYAHISKNFGHDILDEAANRLNVDLYRPMLGYELPLIWNNATYQKPDIASYEVMLCTQIATGRGSEFCFKLMLESRLLQDLIAYAKSHPPPELQFQ